MVQMCAGCERPIVDRFLLNVLDRPWHVKCVQCVDCKTRLAERCFSREGKLFCKTDFFRRYGTKCAGCASGIMPSDLVRRARNKVFHLNCFTCIICRKQLSTGEELYVVDENQFICKDDYLNKPLHIKKSPESLENNNNSIGLNGSLHDCDTASNPDTSAADNSGSEDLMDGDFKDETSPTPSNSATDDMVKDEVVDTDTKNNNSVTGAKRRGPRTTIKAKQLETLKAAFNATPKPTRHIREQLAQETGLNMRVIQVWFQNRRSKERRMKQLSALGARRHHFFRNPRRMRPMRGPYDVENSPDMMGSPPFNYPDHDGHPDYYGPHGYYDFFPGGQPPPDMQGEPLGYLTPVSQGGGPLTSLEPPMHHNLGGLPPEGAQFLPPKDMTPSPEPVPMSGANEVFRPSDRFVPSRAHTPGGPPNGFGRTLSHEVAEGVW